MSHECSVNRGHLLNNLTTQIFIWGNSWHFSQFPSYAQLMTNNQIVIHTEKSLTRSIEARLVFLHNTGFLHVSLSLPNLGGGFHMGEWEVEVFCVCACVRVCLLFGTRLILVLECRCHESIHDVDLESDYKPAAVMIDIQISDARGKQASPHPLLLYIHLVWTSEIPPQEI